MLLLVFLSLISSVFSALTHFPLVKTANGLIKGKVVTNKVPGLEATEDVHRWTYVQYLAFYGIPYAQPPVGDLRFRAPVPASNWIGERDATIEAPVCYQDPLTVPTGHEMSEDCLYINVFTKDLLGVYPVFVWIHGGEFKFGDITDYKPEYLVDKGVVIVTIQYRLAALGFMNLRIPEAAGNQGLKDQVLALRWVRDNIANFGGDPNRVTISGQSAGGISVHGHQVSPMSQGLYHQAVPMSGSLLGYRFFSPEPEKHAYRLGTVLGLNTSDPYELINLLKSVAPNEIINGTNIMGANFLQGYDKFFPFVMSVETEFDSVEAFITKPPIQLISEGSYADIPLMVGTTSHEGVKVLEMLQHNMSLLDEIDKQFDIVVPSDLYDRESQSPEKEDLATRIRQFYFGNQKVSNNTLPTFTQMATESWYNHPVDYWLRLQAFVGYTSNVYYYQFSYDGAFNFFKIFLDIEYAGAAHADDLGYIFYMDVVAARGAGDHRSNIVRQRHVKLFENFIKYGNPTPKVSPLIPVLWEPAQYPTMQYMDIGADIQMVHQSNKRSATKFWAEIYNYPVI